MSDDPEEPIRQLIVKRLGETKRTKNWLSKALNRNSAYIQQYLENKKPKELAYSVKLKIAQLLEIKLTDLGIVPSLDTASAPGAESRGITADVESFTLPRGFGLLPAEPPARTYYRVLSSALDRHPTEPITEGTIIAVDERLESADDLHTEDRLLVELWDKEVKGVTLVIREFVAPRLLITNSWNRNSVIDMDDGGLPFEAIVKGKIVGAHRLKPGNGPIPH